jgi:hypothetical protein
LEQTQSISIPISCYDAYDEVDIQLTNLNNGEVRDLEIRNGVVDFGELTSGRYEVRLNAWQDGYETERVRFYHNFTIPVTNPSFILSVPDPGTILNTDYTVQNFTGWVNLDLSFDCQQQPNVFQWCHISTDSTEVFSETEGIPFEGNRLSFEPEFTQPFYIGFERWTDDDQRGYTTLSEVMRVDINGVNHEALTLGELHQFQLLSDEPIYFTAALESGQAYKVDFYDSSNASFSAVAAVFGTQNYFSAARTTAPFGRARIIQAHSAFLNLNAAKAFEGSPGSAALKVSEINDPTSLLFNDSMEFSFDEKNVTYVIEQFLEAGDYVFRSSQPGYDPEMPVFASIVLEDIPEGVTPEFNNLFDLGPQHNINQLRRNFTLDQAMTVKVYLLTGYHGSTANYSCSLRPD